MSSTPNTNSAASGPGVAKRRRRRWPKVLLALVILVLIVVGVGIAMLPKIASSMAPGIVEKAAAESIKGRVKVEKVSLSWGGPTVLGPIELYDDTNTLVGRVQAETPTGLWKIVSEQWWSKKQLDVGTIDVTGKLDVVRAADGTSNLERATEPRQKTPAPASTSGKKGGELPFDSLQGVLKINGVDVTFTDKSAAAAGTPMAQGVGVAGFGGDVKVDYDAKGGHAVAKADLSGAVKGAGAGTDKLTVKLDADVTQTAQKQVDKVNADVDVQGVPIGLVDGIVGFGGELVKSVGARGDAKIRVTGTPDNATATLAMAAEGASADLEFTYANEVLRTSKPGTIKLRSTTFVGELPSLREKMKELASQVRLEAGPGVDVTIASFSAPVPKAMLGLGGDTTKKLDLRAASVDASVVVGAQRGRVNTAKIAGGAKPTSGDGMEPFTVDPIEVRVTAPRLDGAKRITAATKATIGGRPAGQLAVDVTAAGMFNKEGQFDIGALESASGEAKLLGVTTALVQPIVAASGLALDLAQDVGPTVDLVLKPSTKAGAPSAAGYPATDLNLALASQNVRAGGDLRVDNGVISTLGEGLSVDVVSAGPAVVRLMQPKEGAAPGASVSGKLPVRINLRDVVIDTKKKPVGPADVQARVEVRVSDGVVTLPPPAEGQGLGPVQLSQAVVSAALAPGRPASVGIDAALAHESSPFSVKGTFTADNVAKAMEKKAGAGPIDQLIALGLRGRLDVADAPRSLVRASPGAYASLQPAGADVAAEVKRMVWGMIGPSVDVTLTTEPGQGSQGAKIDVAMTGVTATTTAVLTPTDVTVRELGAQARVTPEMVRPVLGATAKAGGAAPALAAPVTLTLSADPVTIPLKAGTTEPDLARAGTAVVHLRTDAPVLVSGLAVGDRSESVGLASLGAEARAPLGAMLGSDEAAKKAAVVNAKLGVDVLRPGAGGSWAQGAAGAVLAAKAEAEAAVHPNDDSAEKRLTLRLKDVLTAQLSPIVGDPALLPGALGDKVQLAVDAGVSGTTEAGQRIALQANVDAPRLQGASIKGSTQGDVFRVDAARMTWTPAVDLVNKMVFTPKSGSKDPVDQLAEEATFTLDVKSLAVSIPKTVDGTQTQGPLKPGVFNADLALTTPRMIIKRPDGQTVRAEEIRVALTGGQQAGVVGVDAVIGRVTGGEGSATSQGSTLRATVRDVADAKGVLTTDKAVADVAGNLNAFPTPLIDALSGMNGKVVDLLGATLNLDVTAAGVSQTRDGGTITAKADSPRAGAEIKGVVRDQTFVQDGELKIDIYEMVRYNIAKKLPGGMPLVGFIEKKKGADQPATIRATGLRVPMDNDMRKLNGVVTVDPGTASFEFNDAFSKILRELSQKDRGQVGRRLDPFTINIKDGVASYDKFKLKFGEFTLETTGTADLVQKKMDVVTYIPAGAVTEEILNLFKGTLGANAKGFTSETKFPFTTKGPLDNPKTEPDFGLFLKENAGKLLEDVGGKAVEDLLKKLKGNK
jgi:hypothetical protein